MRKIILILAGLLVIIGIFWPIVSKFPLFRLPGDLVFERGGAKICIPITSMLLLSLVLTVLFRLFRI